MNTQFCKCDNCGEWYSEEDVDPVVDFWARVEAGNEMPAGQCRECGSLCYLVKPPRPPLMAHAACIECQNGDHIIYLSHSAAGLLQQIYDYVVEYWNLACADNENVPGKPPVDQRKAVDLYFDALRESTNPEFLNEEMIPVED